MSVIFVDHSYLQGDTNQECLQHIEATLSLLESLGFAVHKGKSILNPTQETEFLGFVFNSLTMTISVTKGKTEAIVSKIRIFRKQIPNNQGTSLSYWLIYFTISSYSIW